MERARYKPWEKYYLRDNLAYTKGDVLVYNIFVFNIPIKATQDETMAYFSQFGEINKVRLEVRKTTTKVGFIHFDHAADAAKVLKQTTPHTLKSKRIYVRACDSWHQPHKLLTNNDAEITEDDEMSSANGKTFNLTMLNDDCLEQIVKKLELKDQVRFSLSCQRFTNVFEMVCKTEHKNHRVDNLDPLTLWEKREFFRAAGPNIEALIGAVPEEDCKRIIEFIIKFCPNIKSIAFDTNALKPDYLFFRLFKTLKHCSVVKLRCCWLNDHDILALKNLPYLEYLSVAENFILTGKHMERLTTVKTLNLHHCSTIQPTHFVEICKSLKDLHSLDIRGTRGLTLFAITQMVKNCHKLESLKISLRLMPYERVAHLPCLKNLTLLSTSWTVPMRLQLLQELAEHKSNQLESLELIGLNCVTSEQAILIACLTNLKHLNCENSDLTDDCLHKFAQLKNLEEIGLAQGYDCTSTITNEGLLQLIRSCPKLKKVNIEYCSRITDQFVFKVIEVLNETQNQRGKQPCVFNVYMSGISSNMINHADYLAATSLMKLNYYKMDYEIDEQNYYDSDEIDEDDYYDFDSIDDID